jgi:uncharacterized repeat protein (TIGR03803 family)
MYQLGPATGLTEGTPGVFYSEGGTPYQGAFSITTKGVTANLGRFPTGYNLEGPLVSGANGRLYSTVQLSIDPATVFSVSLSPGTKLVYSAQQFVPELASNLPNGKFLALGGEIGVSTTYLYVVDEEGTATPIHSFPVGTRLPLTAIYGNDGNYYGVYYLYDGSGSVYRVTPDGAFSKVFTFPTNSFFNASGFVALLQSADGNLYGATTSGGANATGTIYKLTLDGQYTPLYVFPKGPIAYPTDLIEGSDGNLYGSTLGGDSVLFRVTKSGQYTQLHAMNYNTDGACQCLMTQGSDGTIYGTAQLGGPPGLGDVFALNVGLAKPAPWPRTVTPDSGPVGAKVLIWGSNLLAASSVQFNGVAATGVTNSGSNYVWAIVPQGATTGPVTVTTPGGTASTQTVFAVQ